MKSIWKESQIAREIVERKRCSRLTCSCLSGLLSSALFTGRPASVWRLIKVSVTYLPSGWLIGGDVMQPAWTEVRASARMLA